jgi:hypothetical protein
LKAFRLILLFLLLGLFLGAQGAGAQFTSAGLQWADGIEPGTPGTCETGCASCQHVNCNAVSDGDGSYASPFYGFEKLFGYFNSSGNYQLGSARGGDCVYVAGTCGVTGSSDTATGPFKQIRMARAVQYGSTSAPLIIKSELGTTRAIFDCEYASDLSPAAQDATNKPTVAIYATDSNNTAGKAIVIQNILVKRCHGSGIKLGGSGGSISNIIIKNVEFADNKLTSTGTDGALSFPLAEQLVNVEIVNNYFHGNIPGNPACYPTCALQGNDGSLNILSEQSASDGTVANIHDNWFQNDSRPVHQKHNGNATVNFYNNLIDTAENAFYLRAETSNIHHNIILNVPTILRTSGENLGSSVDTSFYNNSVITLTQLLHTETPDWTDAGYFHLYNNIIYSPYSSTQMMDIARYSTQSFSLAHMIDDHNYYYVGSGSQANFSRICLSSGCSTDRSFGETMTYISDTTSTVTDPAFMNVGGGDYSLGALSPARTAGRGGSDAAYLGAIDPGSPTPGPFIGERGRSTVSSRFRQ